MNDAGNAGVDTDSDDEDDEDYEPPDNDIDDQEDQEEPFGQQLEANEDDEGSNDEEGYEYDDEWGGDNVFAGDEINDEASDGDNSEAGIPDHIDNDEAVQPEGVQPAGLQHDIMDETYGPRNHNHGLRARKPRNYDHLHAIMHTILTQYNVRQGLKIFCEQGAAAVVAEMRQLHEMWVMDPVNESTMTKELKKRALGYLMFLSRKRRGKIKARGCADGRKQRIYKSKEEVSSPTVRIESVMLSCTIDAEEKRDVATADVPRAFMHADIDEVIHLRLVGELAKLLTKVDPDVYEQYLVHENGQAVIYVVLNKALYGTLQGEILFWKDLTSLLVEKCGFQVNPYDDCVVNKMINGKQCTILWHVDNLKIIILTCFNM